MNFLSFSLLGGNHAAQSRMTETPALPRKLCSAVRFWVFATLATTAFMPTGHIAFAQTARSPSEYLKRGIERYNAGDLDRAIADFTDAIDLNSGFVKPSEKNHRSHFIASKDSDRTAGDRIVVVDPLNAVAYYDRGMAWLAKREVDRAIDDFDKALVCNPRYIDAYIARGRALHSKKDLTRAIADYDRAIALDRRCAFAYNNRGIARKDLQDFDGAIADFDRVITLNPSLAQAYINRGAARCAVGDLAGARTDLDRAIANEPRNGKAYNNRGTVRQAAGDSEGALADYTQAILLDPENAFAYVNRGLTLLQQGKIIEAETDFKRAVALAPALKPDIERFLREGRHPQSQNTPPKPSVR